MHTYTQREQFIVDACVNGTANTAQKNTIGAAFAENEGQADHYASLSEEQRAAFLVDRINDYVLSRVRQAAASALLRDIQNASDESLLSGV